jgi:hypothetical protein
LFFANKSDLPKALTPAQISEALELNKLTDRPWNIVSDTDRQRRGQAGEIDESVTHGRVTHRLVLLLCPVALLSLTSASNALTGSGLEPGVKWLSGHLPK